MAEDSTAPHGPAGGQRFEALCAGLIRAVSGLPDLHFRAHRLHRGRTPLPWYAPHLHPSVERDDTGSFRGAADGLALRLRLSDPRLHDTLRPSDPVQRLFFEMLEQFRVESLAPDSMPGMRRNLRHRHERWSLGFHHDGLTESARGLLLYAVAQICRARVCGEQVVEETEDMLEATRFALSDRIGHDLAGLKRHRHDQRAYATHALSIARIVAELLEGEGDGEREGGDEAAEPPARDDSRQPLLELIEQMQFDPVEQFTAAQSGSSTVLAQADGAYRIFTNEYDQELIAASMVRPALLREYREQLDRRIEAHGFHLSRITRALQALLAVPRIDDWNADQEEGRIDGRRLARLVASPVERRLFRTERIEAATDCALTLLLDCSGSMKVHGEAVAVMADVLSRALEQAGVSGEVLGFTTQAWNGGRARTDWLRAGRPPHPGRLNERAHWIIKDARTSWRRSRPGFGALLKQDLFREGLDGEAVQWAAARLMDRPEHLKILVVVSDGSPMDSATNQANDPFYLDQHLQDVVGRIEDEGLIRIAGLGVGLDLGAYYTTHAEVDLRDCSGNALFDRLLSLLRAACRH